MWRACTELLEAGRVLKVAIERDGTRVSFADVLNLWQNDWEFRTMFCKELAEAPFAAFRWETPAVTAATLDRTFEFVLCDSPELSDHAVPDAFAEYFHSARKEDVISFSNLGKNAVLVVPCPQGPVSAYAHLAAFVRQAADSQKHSLWLRVAECMLKRVNTRPVWLSTAGAGVPWLHVRLDDKPKYYHYSPYRH